MNQEQRITAIENKINAIVNFLVENIKQEIRDVEKRIEIEKMGFIGSYQGYSEEEINKIFSTINERILSRERILNDLKKDIETLKQGGC